MLFPVITVLVLLLVGVTFSCLGVKICGRCTIYVDDYNEFYLYKKDIVIEPFLKIGANGSSPGYKVWFWPGQKEKLLNKIENEIETYLKSAIPDETGMLKKYKISDDFKKIYIYYNKDADIYSVRRYFSENFEKEIAYKVELYNQFIHGYGKTEFDGNIINYVEDRE